MGDAGYIVLLLAFAAAIYSAIAFALGGRGGHPALTESARNGLLAVFILVTLSVEVLVFALVTHDFSIEYVASYSSRDTSLPYLISGLWAGNAGSLLFWAWLLSLFAAVVTFQKRKSGHELLSYAATILMTTEAFFLILLLWVANPFRTMAFVHPDGMGLNPLLENPGMIIHPPALLAGYVGFAIPFAFAISALLTRRLGDEWIVAVRRWTLLTWLLLGAGNIIGAWWAYMELGWGGYWAWDPVENAGLMPWLVATAFLHSIMMQRRRGMLKVWNMVLIILTFSLAIFGTFLTRSGILSSVHTFSESGLGPLFLAFIGITLLGSLGLLYFRRKELKSEAEMESLVSRESTFLLNNLLLVGAAFAIFFGTIFPVISEAVRGVKITVGAPFFNQVNGPIFLAVILLTGLCALIGWRRASIKNLVRGFLWPLAAAVILGISLVISGLREWYALAAFCLSGFVLFSILYQWFREVKARHRIKAENYFKAFWDLLGVNKPRYGGYIVHLGILLLAIGIIGSSFYDVEKEAVLMQGESMSLNNYTLTYESTDQYDTQSKTVVSATLAVYNKGKLLGKLIPEKHFHRNHAQPLTEGATVTEVAIRSTLQEDLYVILISADKNGRAAFKVLVNPLVNWIWIGGGFLVLGGLIAFWPERQRQATPRQPAKKGNRDEH
ncbi:MAG: heme lyase CcmF/NrfE family subunit [Chloroflexi bacterium]|nr:heme lyase CcmF/NrfE family subunit [Chloroflexota bacterium]